MPPLSGIRIVDLTRVVAGPYCTMMLGDMGAEVLKIEQPEHGDDTRAWGPYIEGQSGFYFQLNRSKKSVAVDLKTPAGAAVLRDLVASADVLIENFRPGSLSQLGFGYTDIAAANPRLIYCSITGYGQSGPCAPLPGYDAVIQGEAGIMDMTGFPDGEPARVGVAITDYLAGLYASQGILLALYERQQSGLGQHVDIALFDAMLSVMRLPAAVLLATGRTPTRVGNDHLSIAPYEPLRARDGLIIVAVANERLWIRFCEALERPDLVRDPRYTTNAERVQHRQELKTDLERLFAGMTVAEIASRLEPKQVPYGRVRDTRQALEHPQVAARGGLITQAHPAVGDITTLGPVVKLSRTPAAPALPPPMLGEHTDWILNSLNSQVESRKSEVESLKSKV
jgi:crotonobetainyl-CoA:carnitine CoA-transferase CaiB-like acyl-CoA transferase